MKLNTKDFGVILLRIGTMLQASGASSNRIRITIDRIANQYKFKSDLLITHRALILTLSDENGPVFNQTKRNSAPGVNFKIVSGISRMSWRITAQKWSLDQIEVELNRLESIPHYHRLIILLTVSLAGASFCRLGNGNLAAMAVAFIGTFAGLFIRQEAHKRKYNPYLTIFLAALTATLVAGAFRRIFPDSDLEMGFAASVLFLIPGVPLINSFVDLFDGNILNGIIRATNSLLIAFMIALGMVCSLLLFKI